MPLRIVFFRPPKLVSTKTLLLKHYYTAVKVRMHFSGPKFSIPLSFPREFEGFVGMGSDFVFPAFWRVSFALSAGT